MLSLVAKRQQFEDNAASMQRYNASAQRSFEGDAKFSGKNYNAALAGLGAAAGSQAEEALLQEEEDKKQKLKRNVRGFAVSTRIAITSEALDAAIKRGRDEAQEAFDANQAEQGRVKAEIVTNDSELTAANAEVHANSVNAFRAADRLSMVEYEAYKLEETGKATDAHMTDAREAGDIGDMRAAAAKLRAEEAERARLEKERLAAEKDCDRTNGDLEASRERRAQLRERGQELRDNLKTLGEEGEVLQGNLDAYDKFRENIKSNPELKAKIENGTVTIEELKAAGAPKGVIEGLEGQELNQQNIKREIRTGYIDIETDTRTAMGTSYKSSYDFDGEQVTRLASAPKMSDHFRRSHHPAGPEAPAPAVQVATATREVAPQQTLG